MYEHSLQYLRCVKCQDRLELEVFEKKSEVVEGILSCVHCDSKYIIVSKIPFLVDDLTRYLSIRAKLGGYLLLHVKNKVIKSLIKKSLQKIKSGEDVTDLEKNWSCIYKTSPSSTFVKKIRNTIRKLGRCSFVIEHGCSIGIVSEMLAKSHGQVFGIDKSFYALLEAKKRKIVNCDFFLSDSLTLPFGKKKFELVVALNVLEIIEPLELLNIINIQAKKFVLLTDPYDYARGKNSVKTKLDAKSLRKKLTQMNFKLKFNTHIPSFISWMLKVNPRLQLHYKVDLILAEK